MNLAIIIVNYNGQEYIKSCIESIDCQTWSGNKKIYIADNKSTDDSVKIIKDNYPLVELMQLDSNKGFGVANNIAIKKALSENCDYIMLLNNDTELHPNMIEELMKYADGNSVLAPSIYWDKDLQNLWYAGGEVLYEEASARQLLYAEELLEGKVQNRVPVSFISGCCMLIPADVISNIGMFDEDFFLYLEDVELCMRMEEHRVPMYYIPKAMMWHKVGGSSGGEWSFVSQYYYYRNRLLLYSKMSGSEGKDYVNNCLKQYSLKNRYSNDYVVAVAASMDFLQGAFGEGRVGRDLVKKFFLPTDDIGLNAYYIVNPSRYFSYCEVYYSVSNYDESLELWLISEDGKERQLDTNDGSGSFQIGVDSDSYSFVTFKIISANGCQSHDARVFLKSVKHNYHFSYSGFFDTEKDSVNTWHWSDGKKSKIDFLKSSILRHFAFRIIFPPDIEPYGIKIYMDDELLTDRMEEKFTIDIPGDNSDHKVEFVAGQKIWYEEVGAKRGLSFGLQSPELSI